MVKKTVKGGDYASLEDAFKLLNTADLIDINIPSSIKGGRKSKKGGNILSPLIAVSPLKIGGKRQRKVKGGNDIMQPSPEVPQSLIPEDIQKITPEVVGGRRKRMVKGGNDIIQPSPEVVGGRRQKKVKGGNDIIQPSPEVVGGRRQRKTKGGNDIIQPSPEVVGGKRQRKTKGGNDLMMTPLKLVMQPLTSIKGGKRQRKTKKGGAGIENIDELNAADLENMDLDDIIDGGADDILPIVPDPVLFGGLYDEALSLIPKKTGGKKSQKGGLIDFNITPFVTSLLLLGIKSAQQSGLNVKVDKKLSLTKKSNYKGKKYNKKGGDIDDNEANADIINKYN